MNAGIPDGKKGDFNGIYSGIHGRRFPRSVDDVRHVDSEGS